MTISEITAVLEEFAPPSFQEDYDNSGLLCGSGQWEARGALLSLDCTEEVIDEAISLNCNLVIAHHPLIFGGLKRITGSNMVQRCVIKAIKHDIAIYACHTNLDNVQEGVNHLICQKLGLKNPKILLPKNNLLRKLVTFVPETHLESVRQSLFEAGAGHIGNYDSCSFSIPGEGTFRGNEKSDPFLGKPGELSREKEVRLEVVLESSRETRVLKALKASHPYEEVAFDVHPLTNAHPLVGSGMIAELETPIEETEFLKHVKAALKAGMLRHTGLRGKAVRKVAVCGGSGRFLLKNAIAAGADAFITADFKYHEFFEVEGRLLLIDPGHYESEQYTPLIFQELIRKKFSIFALHLSGINTNPVNYF